MTSKLPIGAFFLITASVYSLGCFQRLYFSAQVLSFGFQALDHAVGRINVEELLQVDAHAARTTEKEAATGDGGLEVRQGLGSWGDGYPCRLLCCVARFGFSADVADRFPKRRLFLRKAMFNKATLIVSQIRSENSLVLHYVRAMNGLLRGFGV